MKHVVAITAVCLFTCGTARSQGMTGASSLVVTPTADMRDDARVTAGVNVIPDVRLFGREFSQSALSGILEFQFLPFVQLAMRISRVPSEPGWQGIGDRMASARVRLLSEKARLPTVVVGSRDVSGNVHFDATYVVLSKGIGSNSTDFRAHLGYGFPIHGRVNYPIVGFFGGLALSPFSAVRLLAEYDTTDVNFGLHLRPLRGLDVSVSLFGFGAVGGGLAYGFRL